MNKTAWVCEKCDMPLCTNIHQHRRPCKHEHWDTDDEDFGCSGTYEKGKRIDRTKSIPFETWMNRHETTQEETKEETKEESMEEGMEAVEEDMSVDSDRERASI